MRTFQLLAHVEENGEITLLNWWLNGSLNKDLGNDLEMIGDIFESVLKAPESDEPKPVVESQPKVDQ